MSDSASHTPEKSNREVFLKEYILKACAEGDVERVEDFLVWREIDISTMDQPLENSPLYVAVSNYTNEETGHKKVVQLLLENGANAFNSNSSEATVAEEILTKKKDLIDLLLNNIPDINQPINRLGLTLLHIAVRHCSGDVVEKLLVRNADVNLVTNYKLPVLHEAVNISRSDLIDVLVNYGAEINELNLNGCAALHYVKTAEMVKKLVDLGANIDNLSRYGCTPLNVAATKANIEIIEAFLKHGADYRIPDEEFSTPFGNVQMAIHMRKGDTKQNLNIAEAFIRHVRVNSVDLNDFETRYIRGFGAELDKIKSGLMGDSAISFYRFLVSKPRESAKYARNTDIVYAIHKYHSEYFGVAMIKKLYAALCIKRCEDVTRKLLCEMFQNQMPVVVMKHIISYLRITDLMKIDKYYRPEDRTIRNFFYSIDG